MESVLSKDSSNKTEASIAEKIRLLFLCTGNSCRSQMAEGWTRFLKGDQIEVYSAGLETHGLNSSAVVVMSEVGVDISRQYSKHLSELDHLRFDYIITVCAHARESCPLFKGGGIVVHAGFDDPPALAKAVAERGGDLKAQLDCYRHIRDHIRAFVASLPESLETHPINQSYFQR